MWFGKFDPFIVFHDAVFLTKPENHDTKTWYKKGKIFFSLINAGWIASEILHVFSNINQINQLYLSNNEASRWKSNKIINNNKKCTFVSWVPVQ